MGILRTNRLPPTLKQFIPDESPKDAFCCKFAQRSTKIAEKADSCSQPNTVVESMAPITPPPRKAAFKNPAAFERTRG